jgi:hypothetical protein
MNPYPIFAEAAWLRLAVVGVDILAVVLVVRLCGAVTAWWRAQRAFRPARVPIRGSRRRPTRF